MKKFICTLCSLVIVITCITGCGKSSDNPFAADDAIKGQVGNLYYVVPNNATLDEGLSDNSTIIYKVPIKNSAEEYQLIVSCKHTDDENEYKSLIQNIDEMKSQTKNEYGAEITNETINTFLGETIDNGCKREGVANGQKVVAIMAAKEGNVYMLGYSVKTGFYDQSIWDNFYAQLKLV